MYYVGIDLHGTLLPDDEILPVEHYKPLHDAMKKLNGRAQLYVCTGNDLGFVQRKIADDLLELFSGFILETGCVCSDGKQERILVDKKIVNTVKKLEHELMRKHFKEVYKFANRRTSISMFTKHGLVVQEFWKKVKKYVEATEYADVVNVLYSSVAVDIVPKHFDKYRGMREVAGDNPIIGIADSMNDIALLEQCDYAFIPNDTEKSRHLCEALTAAGKQVVPLESLEELDKSAAAQTNTIATAGVIEILRFLDKHI